MMSIATYLAEISTRNSNFDPLTKQEQKALCQDSEYIDQKARNRFVETHLRLVHKLARRYYSRDNPETFADLILAGNEELVRVAKRYDPARGDFTIFAWKPIMYLMKRIMSGENDTVRIPPDYLRVKTMIIQEVNAYAFLSKKPDYQAIAEKINKKRIITAKLTAQQVQNLHVSFKNLECLSLDERIGEETDTTLVELIQNNDERTPHYFAEQEELSNDLKLALLNLNEKEKYVIIKFWGLFGTKALSEREIAIQLGITRQRVNKLKLEAKKKLKQQKLKAHF